MQPCPAIPPVLEGALWLDCPQCRIDPVVDSQRCLCLHKHNCVLYKGTHCTIFTHANCLGTRSSTHHSASVDLVLGAEFMVWSGYSEFLLSDTKLSTYSTKTELLNYHPTS